MGRISTRELTARECAVLRALERHAPMKAIAFELGVSLPSVKTFSQRAYRKLGVGSSADAVRRHRRLTAHDCELGGMSK